MNNNNQINSFLAYAAENSVSKATKIVAGIEFFENSNGQLWSKTFSLLEFFQNVGALPTFTDNGGFVAGRISGSVQKDITEDDVLANPKGFGVSLFLSTEHAGDVIIPMLHRVGTPRKSKITSFDQLG